MVLCTYPSLETARKASEGAVKRKLAACVNMAEIRSVYRWKGRIVREDEWLTIYKTKVSKVTELCEYVRNGHPYDVPEIVTMKGNIRNEKYSEWLETSVA